MPLIKIVKTSKHSGWGLWHITETEEELINISFELPEASIINQAKRMEWMSARILIKRMVHEFGFTYAGINKDEFGKPFLTELPHHISLTHSFPYVAAQIDLREEVGIDLEQPKSKLLTIAPRVLSPTELIDAGTDITKHCIYWCAKETMYKAFGKKGLHFSSQLLVSPFEVHVLGELSGKIMLNNSVRDMKMTYEVTPDFVLVTTKTHHP